MSHKAQIITNICAAVIEEDLTRASLIAKRDYPFAPLLSAGRNYTEMQATQVFIRDGFIDRYSGERLVFPGVLRLLSRLLPTEFPFHPNWKMSETHLAYWELFPTVDHLVPVSRGGVDAEENWVTTSMLRNSAKANWTVDELGWRLVPVGDVRVWDGLTHWFLSYVNNHPQVLGEPYLKRWHQAAKGAAI